MRTIAITGAASGMGAATKARLESDGHRVIGVDQRDADVVADLSSAEGVATRSPPSPTSPADRSTGS